jgi:hypothetical protein
MFLIRFRIETFRIAFVLLAFSWSAAVGLSVAMFFLRQMFPDKVLIGVVLFLAILQGVSAWRARIPTTLSATWVAWVTVTALLILALGMIILGFWSAWD